MRAWKSTRTALCRAGSRPTAPVAGPYWIDTTTANKGVGVESLCRVLGFAHDEVMAFGDNYNDVAMLDLVGTPYIMDGAAAPLRARYPLHTPRPEDGAAGISPEMIVNPFMDESYTSHTFFCPN